jgi:uncharacterized protein
MTALPTGGAGQGAAGIWLTALARVLAFVALTLILALALGSIWAALPFAGADPVLAGSTVTAAAALIAGSLLIRYADGRSPAALGIGVSRLTAVHLGSGLAIGVVALAAAVLGMVLTGSLHYEAAPGTLGEWAAVVAAHAVIFTVAAFAEEALFRGYPFQVLVRAAGPVLATLASSALFAAAHARNPEVGAFALLNIFLAGVLLAAAYLRTLSLWFATTLHMGWNWAMASVFDLPVSGIQLFDTPGYQPVIGGPEWWSGGAFGPEGGLTGTLGFAVALLAVMRLAQVKQDPRIAAAGPLVLQWERGHND